MADLLGRRFILIGGLLVFAGSSLLGGLAQSDSLRIGARFAQGLGAAMLSPAALSTLTSTFRTTRERNTALGVWAAVSGIGGAAGVLFGGLLTEGPGWRWVLFVNIPFSAVAFLGAFLLLKREPKVARLANFDALGALLVTAGMLLLVYALVNAPDVGWDATRTIGELAAAGATLAAFVANELRIANPLVPLSILRIKGIAAADATLMVAAAGFVPMFFFTSLYMQNVLHYSPIETGLAYLPLTGGFIIAAGISSQLFARTGTKPVVLLGSPRRSDRPLLALPNPRRRLLSLRHPARPAGRLDRPRRSLHRRDHGGQRRCRRGQGRSCSRTAKHRAATRCRPRPGDPLRPGHGPHQLAARSRRHQRRPGGDPRLPARADRRCRAHAHRQRPRRPGAKHAPEGTRRRGRAGARPRRLDIQGEPQRLPPQRPPTQPILPTEEAAMSTGHTVNPFEPSSQQRKIAHLVRRIQLLTLELQEARKRERHTTELAAKQRTLEQLRWRLAALARRAAHDDLGNAA